MRRKGQKKRWTEDKCEIAYNLALKGYTDGDLADIFGVGIATIDSWKTHKPEFMAALRAGKALADGRIAKSFFRSAKGYHYYEEVAFCKDGVVTKARVKRYQHPNAFAAYKWLTNRDRTNWVDLQKSEMKLTLNSVDMSDMTDEELSFMEKMGMKKLGEVMESKISQN
jgi:hypothetical protein